MYATELDTLLFERWIEGTKAKKQKRGMVFLGWKRFVYLNRQRETNLLRMLNTADEILLSRNLTEAY
jgi:hypothetical protein